MKAHTVLFALSSLLCLAKAEQPLEITVSNSQATLTWPGGDRLFSSSDLSDWNEILGATSPHVRQLSNDGREFFALLPPPLVANNVAIAADHAYAALGDSGLAIINLNTRCRTFLDPATRVDDLSIDGQLLFTLNGSQGMLSAYSLADPASPLLVSGPISVPSSTFTGVSAAAGRVVVSGGTSLLTLRNYSPTGQLSPLIGNIDLGIGQPDVILSANGSEAYVSTDFFSANRPNNLRFGITTLDLTPPLNVTSRTGLPGAGFSRGSQAPSNFPIESALLGESILIAHGNGLAIIQASSGILQSVISLGFAAVNVDVSGNSAFVVGIDSTGVSRLAEIDFTTPANPVTQSNQPFPNASAFTGVAASQRFIVIAGNQTGLEIIPR